ncbi:MAG: hypothetical protein QOI47_748 [Actinomycetota bacterium]|nr:hypothetical protein [Actinomycetota bacterium]
MEREPFVIPGLLSADRSAAELGIEMLAGGHEVVTDEAGMVTWFLSEHDTEALLTDPRFGATAMAVLHLSGVAEGPLHDLWSNLMFGKDGEEHKRLRGAVAKHFTPSALAWLAPAADEIAHDLAAALPDDEIVDLWPAYSLPLSARIACRVVGIEDDDAAMVAPWALALVKAFSVLQPADRDEAEAAAVAFGAHLDGVIARKRDQPGDDVTSWLLEEASDVLSDDELRAMVGNLVFGGLEATTKGLLTAVFHLLGHGLWPELTDPANVSRAVTETLRFHPPATGVFRLAIEEVDCGGTVLQPGQLAVPNLVAACRDPKRYDDADALQLDRKPGRPYPFGAGPHFCLGFNQAKITLAAGLGNLAARAPHLRLAVDAAAVPFSRDPFDGVTSLPVRLR